MVWRDAVYVCRTHTQEPIIIMLMVLLPFVLDAITSNDLSGEIVNSFLEAVVSNCVAPVKAAMSNMMLDRQ